MSSGIHIHLEADYQRLAMLGTIPADVSRILPHPLQHQVDTFTALQEHDLVINAFPTGTGKTKAALLWLLQHPHANALLIAPVNELVRQHAKDAQQFVDDAGLPHVVAAVDAVFAAASKTSWTKTWRTILPHPDQPHLAFRTARLSGNKQTSFVARNESGPLLLQRVLPL